jgi:hypothetical protein
MVWSSDGLLFKSEPSISRAGRSCTVNPGVAGVVGVYFAGPRIGHLKEAMPPHSLALTMVGAGLSWVGWFGFNAGSALEANGTSGGRDDEHDSSLQPPGADVDGGRAPRFRQGVDARRSVRRGRQASSAVTPAAGRERPIGAILLGSAASLVCYGFVGSLKNRLRLDDSLDVCSGSMASAGSIGSIGTAFVALSRARRSTEAMRYALGHQLIAQLAAVAVAIAWSATGIRALLRVVKVDDTAAPRTRRGARGSRHRRSRRARVQLLSGDLRGELAGIGPEGREAVVELIEAAAHAVDFRRNAFGILADRGDRVRHRIRGKRRLVDEPTRWCPRFAAPDWIDRRIRSAATCTSVVVDWIDALVSTADALPPGSRRSWPRSRPSHSRSGWRGSFTSCATTAKPRPASPARGRLDRRVQCKQVGLPGDGADQAEDGFDGARVRLRGLRTSERFGRLARPREWQCRRSLNFAADFLITRIRPAAPGCIAHRHAIARRRCNFRRPCREHVVAPAERDVNRLLPERAPPSGRGFRTSHSDASANENSSGELNPLMPGHRN